MRGIVSSFVFVVVVVTAAVGLGTVIQAKPGDCCGHDYGGSCDLRYPNTPCSANEDCAKYPDYSTCCPAAGFCGS